MNKKGFGLIDLVALLALVLGAGAAVGGIAVAPGTQLDVSLLGGGFVVALLGLVRLFRFFRF